MPGKTTCFLLTMILCQTFGTSVGQAEDSRWGAVGIRGGMDLTDSHKSSRDHFEGYELFANYLLPLEWRGSSGLGLGTRLDTSVGALRKDGASAIKAAFGPSVTLGMFSDRVELEIGAAAAYLSKHEFPERNLGGPFQFVLHTGVGFLALGDLGIGYRFEHISNAFIYPHNPGVNLHVLEFNYRL